MARLLRVPWEAACSQKYCAQTMNPAVKGAKLCRAVKPWVAEKSGLDGVSPHPGSRHFA